MSKIFVGCLLFVLSGSFFAQQSKEEKLAQLKSRSDIKVTEVQKDILKLEYPNGKILYKNIGDYHQPTNNNQLPTYAPNYDSTIIDLTNIDTTLYSDMYSFWQEVIVSNYDYPTIGDINNNGRIELYGFERDYGTPQENAWVKAKELNISGKFEPVWDYDSTTIAENVYDIDGDGNLELQIKREEYNSQCDCSIDKELFYKKNSDTSLATELSFTMFRLDTGEVQYQPTFDFLDGDTVIDYFYSSPPYLHVFDIYEYNYSENSFDFRFRYDYSSLDAWFEGFAVKDFDMDNYPEVILGGTHGQVIGFEASADNQYNFILQDEVETHNAYMFAVTNDNDRNGRKEFWVGGDSYYNGVPITRLTCFEAIGNNVYEIVAKIDLIGVFSFYAYNMQAVDIDKDGIDELMVCIDQNFLILKFIGGFGYHIYSLWYIKQNELAISGENSIYWGATMFDLDNDNRDEILIAMDQIINQVGIRYFTSIYKPDGLTNVEYQSYIPTDYSLEQNYPNPFNSTTQISFSIRSNRFVILKVYNILGKEIITLLEKELSPGSYSINWEAKDEKNSTLPSGIYFIKIVADSFTKTIKAVLLK